jgi:hypothetical protein
VVGELQSPFLPVIANRQCRQLQHFQIAVDGACGTFLCLRQLARRPQVVLGDKLDEAQDAGQAIRLTQSPLGVRSRAWGFEGWSRGIIHRTSSTGKISGLRKMNRFFG